ncbi:hypothetical protein THO17_12090 [Marinomonas sp. THO17]
MACQVSAAIFVLHDSDESSVRSLSFQLSKRLSVSETPMPVRQAFFLNNITRIESQDVVIAIGSKQFEQACLVMSRGAIIGLFIGQEEFQSLSASCTVAHSAVFSGAPLEKRLALLQAIWLDPKPLAVLFSDTLPLDQAYMQNVAQEYGFEFVFLQTKTDRISVLKSVNRLLEESELVFALVDSHLFQQGNAQDILKLLFHQQKVMVGSSFAFVRAGALFAIDSDADAKLTLLSDMVAHWQATGITPPAAYPSILRVSFNPYLVKAHGIVLPSQLFLKEQFGLCSDTEC